MKFERLVILNVAIFVSLSAEKASGYALIFSDQTAAKNLGAYRAAAGDSHAPGGIFTDLNNDGYPDLYLVSNDAAANYSKLYLNVPDGSGGRTFALQTNALGAVNNTGVGTNFNGATGAIAADYDNDGDTDIYVTNFGGTNRLYQNQLANGGGLTFVDVTNAAGVSGINPSPHTDHSLTAAWADPDRDGDLDLYVGNHNLWNDPLPFDGARDTFYINNGDGTFTDATLTYGVTGYENAAGGDTGSGQTFSATNGVIFADFNNDQWPDLLVTNKTGGADDRDMLYINQGNDAHGNWLGYETATYDATMAGSFGGNLSQSAMGVNVGDIDGDGDLDIYISDNPGFGPVGQNDLFINQLAETGTLSFQHRHVDAGLSWGVQIEDFDNDGFLEIHVTNDPAANGGDAALFQFDDPSNPLTSLIADISNAANANNPHKDGRGSMAADYNRDGKLDLFLVNLVNDIRFNLPNDASALLENTTDDGNHFLSIKLIGDPDNPTDDGLATSRDAIGSRVLVLADVDGDSDFELLLREVVSGSSNAASTSSLDLEFGLGQAEQAFVTVLWADGRISELGLIDADQFLVLDQYVLIPEPASLALLGVGGLMVARWRRRQLEVHR